MHIQDAYAIDRKMMNSYVPLPLETEESGEDLHATVFAVGGGSPPQRMASTSSMRISSPSLMMMKLMLKCITFSFNRRGSSWAVNHRHSPLRSAYATTFNGSPGLTLQRAVFDLHSDPFARGQLHTVPSRVRNRNATRVLLAPKNEDRDTANIIFKRLLL